MKHLEEGLVVPVGFKSIAEKKPINGSIVYLLEDDRLAAYHWVEFTNGYYAPGNIDNATYLGTFFKVSDNDEDETGVDIYSHNATDYYWNYMGKSEKGTVQLYGIGNVNEHGYRTFKKVLADAVKNNKTSFIFLGVEVVVDYAKYLVEYEDFKRKNK